LRVAQRSDVTSVGRRRIGRRSLASPYEREGPPGQPPGGCSPAMKKQSCCQGSSLRQYVISYCSRKERQGKEKPLGQSCEGSRVERSWGQ
jgi:hypothetical protein